MKNYDLIEWITSYEYFLQQAKQLITSQTVFSYSKLWHWLWELKKRVSGTSKSNTEEEYMRLSGTSKPNTVPKKNTYNPQHAQVTRKTKELCKESE